jgi:predicted nucleotidyltransferase
MTIDPRLHRIVAAQPYPLLFATISGAHLYGFPSPDSDYDLRGAHVLPLNAVVGLEVRDETVQSVAGLVTGSMGLPLIPSFCA